MKKINKKLLAIAFNMCGNTYIDTICVHPLKSAYSLLKMLIAEERKTSPQVGGL